MYELRNVKGHYTHDGYSFVASIYEDGSKIGTVENDGRGGPCCYVFNDGFGRQSKHYLAFVATAVANGHGDFEPEDGLIYALLDEHETRRMLRRAAKTSILFLLDGDSIEDGVRTLKVKAVTPEVTASARKYLTDKYGTAAKVWDGTAFTACA